jgi:RNA polymerase sigma-70 factor (ECF subfamily)
MEFQVVDPRPPADEEVSAIQQTKIIEKIISELPEKQRAVMALYYTHRMSPVEIAQTLDISLNNLRVQLHKARCRMFEEYKKMTEEN